MIYNLPVSISTEYKPYKVIGDKILVISDVHIPYHNIRALESVFNFTIGKKIDTVLILGDLMDCHKGSKFCIDPSADDLDIEVLKTIKFLKELKRIYPKAKIIYKFGNHEKRWEVLLKSKVPELAKFKQFTLNAVLGLEKLRIEYVEENRYISLNGNKGLSLLHGHEYGRGTYSPANPARTLFLRTKATALQADRHQSSDHTETSIDGSTITCWSIGCLSELNPKYMPLNKWNHGFAIYERETEKIWHVHNKVILRTGQVV